MFTYTINQQKHIYKYVKSRISHIILQQHVSIASVTNIRVSYNNKTIRKQIILQKCTINPLNVTIKFLTAKKKKLKVTKRQIYKFTFLLKYGTTGRVYVVRWMCTAVAHPVTRQSTVLGITLTIKHIIQFYIRYNEITHLLVVRSSRDHSKTGLWDVRCV